MPAKVGPAPPTRLAVLPPSNRSQDRRNPQGWFLMSPRSSALLPSSSIPPNVSASWLSPAALLSASAAKVSLLCNLYFRCFCLMTRANLCTTWAAARMEWRPGTLRRRPPPPRASLLSPSAPHRLGIPPRSFPVPFRVPCIQRFPSFSHTSVPLYAPSPPFSYRPSC